MEVYTMDDIVSMVVLGMFAMYLTIIGLVKVTDYIKDYIKRRFT